MEQEPGTPSGGGSATSPGPPRAEGRRGPGAAEGRGGREGDDSEQHVG